MTPGASADVFMLTDGARRLVAKYAYQLRADFEPGLRCAELLAEGGMRTARPVHTDDGELLAMVEWPVGHWHPLAVLEWVDGRAPSTRADSLQLLGRVCAEIHARLLNVDPADLGLGSDPNAHLAYLEGTHQDLGDMAWRRALPLFRALNAAVYAKFAARKWVERSSRGEPLSQTRRRLDELLSFVRREAGTDRGR